MNFRIGRPSLALLTTKEMNDTQFGKFKEAWIQHSAAKLMADGVSDKLALTVATQEFAKEDFSARDAAVVRNRPFTSLSALDNLYVMLG